MVDRFSKQQDSQMSSKSSIKNLSILDIPTEVTQILD